MLAQETTPMATDTSIEPVRVSYNIRAQACEHLGIELEKSSTGLAICTVKDSP